MKSGILVYASVKHNWMKIRLIASGIFAVSLGIEVEINCQWGLSNGVR